MMSVRACPLVLVAAGIGTATALAGCADDEFNGTGGIYLPTTGGTGTGDDDGGGDTPGSDTAVADDSSGTAGQTDGGSSSETAGLDETAGALCGNNVVEDGEVCDGSDLADETCVGLGFDEGELACSPNCNGYVERDCVLYSCGDDQQQGREVCDGDDLAGETCVTRGYDDGPLSCTKDCAAFDESGCFLIECGDNAALGPEVCDGDDLLGEDCPSQGYDGGVLACAATCMAFDFDECTTCGDTLIEGDEICDASNLAGQDCTDHGYADGVLACADDCLGWDLSQCNTCGNAMIEGAEVCDAEDLDGQTCLTLGFDAGALACADTCDAFDTTPCCLADDLGSTVGSPVVVGTNAGGGDDTVGTCDGSVGPDVGYFWTAPATGTYTIDTLGSDYDTVLYVLNACGGTELACNGQAFGGDQSSVQLAATEGQTYLITVDGWDGATGTHHLNITPSQASCTAAALGNATGTPVAAGANAGAGDAFMLSPCTFTTGEDVAWTWIAPSTGHYAFDTLGSNYDTVLGVHDGCGGTQLACDDQGGGGVGLSALTMPVTAGVPYVVIVDGWNDASGSYQLNIEPDPGSCNEADLGAAVGVAIGGGTNAGMGDDTQPSCTATTGEDLAFRWTAPTSGAYSVDTFGSDFDTVLYVLEDCGGSELVCNNQAGGGSQSQTSFAATAGATYSIVVDGFADAGAISLSINPVPAACVDVAATAQLGEAIATGSTVGAGNDEQTGCTATAGDDVVVEWIAPASGTYTADTFGSDFDTILEVRTNCTTSLGCNDQAGGVGPQSEMSFTVVAGQSIRFVIDGWNGADGNYVLNVNGPY